MQRNVKPKSLFPAGSSGKACHLVLSRDFFSATSLSGSWVALRKVCQLNGIGPIAKESPCYAMRFLKPTINVAMVSGRRRSLGSFRWVALGLKFNMLTTHCHWLINRGRTLEYYNAQLRGCVCQQKDRDVLSGLVSCRVTHPRCHVQEAR